MWKRDEAVRPTNAQPVPTSPAPQTSYAGSALASTAAESRTLGNRDMVNIGKSIVIKGELNGSEDLTIEG
jgi:hypothetical protein